MPEVAFGKKVSAAFKTKVLSIAKELDTDPSFLMACMAFESGETFRADKKAGASSAIGLIQFMPATAKRLGTTSAKLAAMTAEDQLDFVRAYMLPFKGRFRTLSDVYMAILWPKAVGKAESFVLFAKGDKAFEPNKGLDGNKDGTVTKAEAAALVNARLVKGMRDDLRG